MVKFIQSENYIQPFEGNREADVAPGENEFDTPVLGVCSCVVVKMSENCSKHGFADHIEIRLGKDNSIFHIVFLIVFFH